MLVALASLVAPAIASDDFKLLRVDGRIVRWPSQGGQPVVLTYALADRSVRIGDFGTCGDVEAPRALLENSHLAAADLLAAVERAFDQWQRNVNVRFMPAQSASRADVIIGAATAPRGIAFTDLALAPASQSPTDTRTIRASVICLNPEKSWKIGFNEQADQYDIEHVLAHEIGHVLGLDHPSAFGHVMSFRYSEARRELSTGDRLGAVQLYGVKAAPSN